MHGFLMTCYAEYLVDVIDSINFFESLAAVMSGTETEFDKEQVKWLNELLSKQESIKGVETTIRYDAKKDSYGLVYNFNSLLALVVFEYIQMKNNGVRLMKCQKVDKKNFLQRIKESIESTKTYPNSVLESSIKTILSSALTNKTYNATLKTNCINKGELNPRYIDAFLDVLCLYCNNPSFDPDKYKVDFIKKDKILNLVPEEINDNCEKVINALDRALFFFQTRCGIRTIGEINYNLMLVLVGTLFMEDSYFYNYEVHRLLEAWYWSVVFSGEYDKDQNSHMISNLQNIVRCVSGTNRDLTWLNSISANVLKMTNFSDKDLLLMNKVNEDRYPKPVLRNFMCQYLLSGTYMDMFDETKKISVFCEDADTLEAHHIIPLGSAKKVGEITADIRKNPRHICNSPLNFVYITKAANKDISDDALDAYEKKIQPAAKAALFISSYTPASHDTEIKVRGLLESRYSMMQGTISGEINDLLTNWM